MLAPRRTKVFLKMDLMRRWRRTNIVYGGADPETKVFRIGYFLRFRFEIQRVFRVRGFKVQGSRCRVQGARFTVLSKARWTGTRVI
jgi:hypothetical protein